MITVDFFSVVHRSRLKWLNAPVKATEYKRERDLNISEPVLIKDMKPEKEHKDDEVALLLFYGALSHNKLVAVGKETLPYRVVGLPVPWSKRWES